MRMTPPASCPASAFRPAESKLRDSTPGTAIASRRSPKILALSRWHCKHRCSPASSGTRSFSSPDRGLELALDLELARVHRDAAARCLGRIHRGEGLGPGPQVLLLSKYCRTTAVPC